MHRLRFAARYSTRSRSLATALAASLLALSAPRHAHAVTGNVAQGKTVTPSGTFGTAKPVSSIVDGTFVANGDGAALQLNWTTPYTQSLTVDLGATYAVESAIVQADQNDFYRIELGPTLTGPWTLFWNVPDVPSTGGMQTRSSGPLAVVSGRYARFTSTSGDNLRALSELQLTATYGLTLGNVCTAAAQCASGNCVDGRCCNSACNGTCQKCSNGFGLCNPVQNADDPDTCAGTLTCNATGNCLLDQGQSCVNGTQCASGSCVDGRCCNSACDGVCESCANPTGTCSPVINAEDPGTCSGASSCESTGACKLKNGQTCTAGGDCVSGNCVDGVCCNTPCNGVCQSCSLTAGTCSAIVNTEDPAGCSGVQACDPAGVCKLKDGAACGVGAQCLSGNCVDGVCCNTPCNGACQSCSVTAGLCSLVISGDDDACSGSVTCDATGACKKQLGQGCTGAGECAGGQCVDGVCCDTSCDGVCQSCAINPGFCTPVTNGDDPGMCAAAATCDPQGVCKLKNGTSCTGGGQCLTGFCVDGVCCDTPCNDACDSCAVNAGTCAPASAGTVGAPACPDNLLCNGSSPSCPGSCVDDGGCAAGFYCATSVCKPKAADGVPCAASNECGSGICADGVCCATTCTGACTSCAVGQGVCAAVIDAEDDSCQGNDICNSQGLCLAKQGQSCSASSACASGLCVDGLCCNTVCAAACESCSLTPGVCSTVTGGVDDACSGASACSASGACLLVDGNPCSSGGECLSGACVDGFCCNSPCAGPCQSCATTPGVCSPVTVGQDAPSCTGNQTCSPQGFCLGAMGSPCVATAECASGHCVDGVCCDSPCDGVCQTCAPAGVCQGITGAADADSCASPGVCVGPGVCGKGAGQPCAPGDTCATGFCADGFCCDSACDSPCRTCAATPGSCEAVVSQIDADSCAGPDTCSAKGVCLAAPGHPCGSPLECASGFCVDGVCCATSCTEPCRTCDATPGSCSPITDGPDPGSCEGAQLCDASAQCKVGLGGACSSPDQCASGFCADGVCCASACTGACERCDAEPGFCSPFKVGSPGVPACPAGMTCDGASGDCPGACEIDAQCGPGFFCAAGKCKPLLPLGDGCSGPGECASGFCVDDVCCDGACGEGSPTDCQACSAALGAAKSGSCGPIAKGTVCRPVNDPCDLAELCAGDLACPADARAADGSPCEGGTCQSGACVGAGGASGAGGQAGQGGAAGEGGFAGAAGEAGKPASGGASAGKGGAAGAAMFPAGNAGAAGKAGDSAVDIPDLWGGAAPGDASAGGASQSGSAVGAGGAGASPARKPASVADVGGDAGLDGGCSQSGQNGARLPPWLLLSALAVGIGRARRPRRG